MANHLTPDELSKELGIDRQDVIRVCIEEGVPIYQGKIDKTLFQAQLERSARSRSRTSSRASDVTATCARPCACGGRPRGSLLRRLRPSAGFSRCASSTLAPQRLHQVDDRRLLRLRLGHRDLLAGRLRLEHRAQVAAVVALEVVRVELGREARDHLPRELELRLLHLVSSTASSISACE